MVLAASSIFCCLNNTASLLAPQPARARNSSANKSARRSCTNWGLPCNRSKPSLGARNYDADKPRYASRVNSNTEISGRAPSRMGKPVVPMPRLT
jgi:hypothetical protein